MSPKDKKAIKLAEVVAKSSPLVWGVHWNEGGHSLVVSFIINTGSREEAWLILDTAIGNLFKDTGMVAVGRVTLWDNGTFGTMEPLLTLRGLLNYEKRNCYSRSFQGGSAYSLQCAISL